MLRHADVAMLALRAAAMRRSARRCYARQQDSALYALFSATIAACRAYRFTGTEYHHATMPRCFICLGRRKSDICARDAARRDICVRYRATHAITPPPPPDIRRRRAIVIWQRQRAICRACAQECGAQKSEAAERR